MYDYCLGCTVYICMHTIWDCLLLYCSSLVRVVTVDRKLSDLRRQLRQFTSTTQVNAGSVVVWFKKYPMFLQHDLEMERARLKTQLAVAEEELARYKEFVNDRLIRLVQQLSHVVIVMKGIYAVIHVQS